MKHWKVIDSKYLFKEKWLTLRNDRCLTASGVIIDPYYIRESADWVQVVAFDEGDRILTVRQYRHGEGRISLEVPGGIVESGETPLEAAKRELLEETGCQAEQYEYLIPLNPNPAEQANTLHSFMAFGTRQVQPPDPDLTENIEFSFMTVQELLSQIDQGNVFHTLHVSSIFYALRRRKIQAW